MKVLALLLGLSLALVGKAQRKVDMQTQPFAIKGGDTLKMDIYRSVSAKDSVQPCIIYIFGGGFITGSRNDSLAVSNLKKLATKGFTVVSIDYRLGFEKALGNPKTEPEKVKTNLKTIKPKGFLNLFYGSIKMAEADLFDATTYLTKHAQQLHINPTQLIPLGSSAGAVTTLHAQYDIANRDTIAQNHLPKDFQYAGAISMSGAIFSLNGDLKWQRKPSPILFFHGDADQNVPYDKVRIKILLFTLKYGFFGSKYIAQQLSSLRSPYTFYSFCNRKHEICFEPLINQQDVMATFIHRTILDKDSTIRTVVVDDLRRPILKKDFGFRDYIKGNFGK